jgi:hypothetical protein
LQFHQRASYPLARFFFVITGGVLKSGFLGSHKGLETTNTDNGVAVSVPATAPDQYSSTVVLKINGALEID